MVECEIVCGFYRIAFPVCCQVCDSDTMLDPASSVEMVKVLEEDPMVGGVGGDVQVRFANRFNVLEIGRAHV